MNLYKTALAGTVAAALALGGCATAPKYNSGLDTNKWRNSQTTTFEAPKPNLNIHYSIQWPDSLYGKGPRKKISDDKLAKAMKEVLVSFKSTNLKDTEGAGPDKRHYFHGMIKPNGVVYTVEHAIPTKYDLKNVVATVNGKVMALDPNFYCTDKKHDIAVVQIQGSFNKPKGPLRTANITKHQIIRTPFYHQKGEYFQVPVPRISHQFVQSESENINFTEDKKIGGQTIKIFRDFKDTIISGTITEGKLNDGRSGTPGFNKYGEFIGLHVGYNEEAEQIMNKASQLQALEDKCLSNKTS